MAYAGALFADACLRGLNGDANVVEPTFVQSQVTELPFFASKVRLGPSGVQSLPLLPSLVIFHLWSSLASYRAHHLQMRFLGDTDATAPSRIQPASRGTCFGSAPAGAASNCVA